MAIKPYTKQQMRDNKGPLDNPSLANYKSSTVSPIEKVRKAVVKYKYGSKGITKTEVPQYAFGIGSIMGLFGKAGGGGGGGLGSLFGKAAPAAGEQSGKFNMNTVMDMAKSGSGNQPQPAPSAPPAPTAPQEQGTSDDQRVKGNVMAGMADPKAASAGVPGGGGSGGVAGNIPVYGQFIQMFDKKLDQQAAAIAELNQPGERLNKYKKGSAGVNKMEGGTPYYTGTEDMGGIVHFAKKDPLRKWEGIGKTMQLASQVASVLNQQADKYTGGMASKGTNNIAGMGAAVGSTTIGDKDYGGSAGNQAAVKAPTKMQTPQIVNPNEGYGMQVSQGTKVEEQNNNLQDGSVNSANVPPLTPLTTPQSKRANTGGLFSNQNLFKQGLVEGGLKKGTAKLKFKRKQ